MQEISKKTKDTDVAISERQLIMFVQSKVYSVEGTWAWEMAAEQVFCSDVMYHLEEDFSGTKGLIHPDDLPQLLKNIYFTEAIGEEERFDFSFRIITTYGEVKSITGKNVRFVKNVNQDVHTNPVDVLLKQMSEAVQLSSDYKVLALRKDISDFYERTHRSGTWYYNTATSEAYYSDNHYRLFGLAPNTLNAQLFTFANFIHPEDKDVVIEAVGSAVRLLLPLDLQFRIIRADDELIYVHYVSHVSFNKDGETVIYGVLKDVTHNKQKEIELENAQALLNLEENLIEFSETTNNSGHWYVDLLTRKFVFSDYYYKIFGLKVVGQTPAITVLADRVHPDDKYGFIQVHRKMLLQNVFTEYEFRVVKADGKTRDVVLKGKSMVTSKNEMVIIGTIKDVTGTRVLESKVKELTEDLFVKRIFLKNAETVANITGWVTDAADETIWVSENFYNVWGIRGDNAPASVKLLSKAVHPDDRDSFLAHINGQNEYFIPKEEELRIVVRRETKYCKVTIKTVLEDGTKYNVVVVQDVSNQKVLQEKYKDKEGFARLLTETVEEKILFVDTNYNFLEWNKECEKAFNKKKEEVLDKNYFDVFPQFKNADIVQSLSRSLNGETVTLEINNASYLKGHHVVTFSPLKDDADTITGVLQMFTDRTKQTGLQQHLNSRLYFIENIIEASVDPLIVLDKHLNYMYWNRSTERLSGINKEYIVGKNMLEMVPPFVNIPTHVDFKRALAGETVRIPVQDNEDEQYYEMHLSPLKDDKNTVTAVLWLIRDLTPEYELLHQQKKAAQVLNSVNAVFIELDEEYRYKFVNDTAQEYLGKCREELMGRRAPEVFPEIVGTPGYQAIERGMREKVRLETEYFSSVFNRWVYQSIIPTADGVLIFFYDRQDIKETQQQLQDEHRRLKEAQSVGRLGSFEWNAASDKIIWSDELYRLHGLEPQSEVITLDKVFSYIHPDESEQVKELLMEARIKAGKCQVVHKILRADGEVRLVVRRMQTFADNSGAVTHLTGTVQDITDHACDRP